MMKLSGTNEPGGMVERIEDEELHFQVRIAVAGERLPAHGSHGNT